MPNPPGGRLRTTEASFELSLGNLTLQRRQLDATVSGPSDLADSDEGHPLHRRLAMTAAALISVIVDGLGIPGLSTSDVTLTQTSATTFKVTIALRDAQTLSDAGADSSSVVTTAAITQAVTSPAFTSSLGSDSRLAGVSVQSVSAPVFVAEVVEAPSPPPPSIPPSLPPPISPVELLMNSNGELVTEDAELKVASADAGVGPGQMAALVAVSTLIVVFIVTLPAVMAFYTFLRKKRGGVKVNPNSLMPVVPVEAADMATHAQEDEDPMTAAEDSERPIMSTFAPPTDSEEARRQAQAAYLAAKKTKEEQQKPSSLPQSNPAVGILARMAQESGGVYPPGTR